MINPSELKDFFNDISLSGFECLAERNCEDISSRLELLEESFQKHIEELKRQIVDNNGYDNPIQTNLLDNTDNVEFIKKGIIIDESSLTTQTEFINHWISQFMLCQKTITLLVNYLKKKCYDYKLHWKKYIDKDISEVRDERYLFLTIHKLYGQIYGLCQNVAIAIDDYFKVYRKLKSYIGIRGTDFIKPPVADPEITVSERISLLQRETENCLLINPEKSILGFSAVRIELESYIIIKIRDKMRQCIRMKDGNNDLDVKFKSQLQKKEVFGIIKELFPQQKEEYDALNTIYRVSSRTVHRAIPYPNYLSWGSSEFVLDKLKNMIDNLDPNDTRLQNIITKLKSEGIIRVVPSTWYIT
jgi:hypothetical protein